MVLTGWAAESGIGAGSGRTSLRSRALDSTGGCVLMIPNFFIIIPTTTEGLEKNFELLAAIFQRKVFSRKYSRQFSS